MGDGGSGLRLSVDPDLNLSLKMLVPDAMSLTGSTGVFIKLWCSVSAILIFVSSQSIILIKYFLCNATLIELINLYFMSYVLENPHFYVLCIFNNIGIQSEDLGNKSDPPTHTHTQREREKERERETSIYVILQTFLRRSFWDCSFFLCSLFTAYFHYLFNFSFLWYLSRFACYVLSSIMFTSLGKR